jgi:hypothetical protein
VRGASVVIILAVGACDLDLERMIDQPRYDTYEACAVCPEGTIMMQPPVGTVPRGLRLGPSEWATGRGDAGFTDRIPVALDRALLGRGRNRYDIFCAACPGRLGNGISQVSENMALRPPPNLLAPPYTEYAPGRVFAAVTEGYGMMRSYAAELPVEDRWAVVAYLQALQLSQRVALDELPPPIQQEARRWLK